MFSSTVPPLTFSVNILQFPRLPSKVLGNLPHLQHIIPLHYVNLTELNSPYSRMRMYRQQRAVNTLGSLKGMESCLFPSFRRHQELVRSSKFPNVPVIQINQSEPLHSTSCVLVRDQPIILRQSRASASRILFRYLAFAQRDSQFQFLFL